MLQKMQILFLILMVMTSGCATSSEWVKRDYSPKRRGILRYKNVAHQATLETLQADAGDKMSQFCGDKLKVQILSEELGERISGSTTKSDQVLDMTSTTVNRDNFTYVKFDCL